MKSLDLALVLLVGVAGGVAMGVFIGFACVVTATAARVLERVLQSAGDLKSENHLGRRMASLSGSRAAALPGAPYRLG